MKTPTCMPQAMAAGLISTNEYRKRYGCSNSTFHVWLRSGKLYGVKIAGRWYVENKDCRTRDPRFQAGRKRCVRCRRWRGVEHFGGVRRGSSGYCRECCAEAQRIRNGDKVAAASFRQEVIAQNEILGMDDASLADREQRILAHAGRIEAMGLAGDGEDWPDGE